MTWTCSASVAAALCIFAGCAKANLSDGQKLALQTYGALIDSLKPLHRLLGKPAPDDWLAQHHEPGQTFNEYLVSAPITPTDKRKVIYIQPLGDFTENQRKVLELTADYMGRFFNLAVKTKGDMALSTVPAQAKRKHPQWGMNQILTSHVLQKILRPALPDDAAMYIALTSSDLWPGQGWNFVFGEATLRDRVGVWSIYRNGDANKGGDEFKLCLLRTIKTAVHEAGHMFSMYHCTKYECVMCGSNNREESDRRPLWCCPECVAKVCWATGADPVERYDKLAEFCRANGFQTEAAFFEKSSAACPRAPTSSARTQAPR